MKVKFKNGTTKGCSTPTEQKIFKTGTSSGWILTFYLICDITSDEVDELLTEENISELTFTAEETMNAEGIIVPEKSIVLTDYNKISSSVIRHSEEKDKTRVEIQLIKGV